MKTYKALINDQKDTIELQNLLEIYEEIAATKMQQVRSGIVAARNFYDKLISLSDEVGTDLGDVIKTTHKEAAVFLAANTGLYGDIVDKTFTKFLEFVGSQQVDIFIVGKAGERLMKTLGGNLKYEVFHQPDDSIDTAALKAIMEKLVTYKKTHVFYGKFVNIAVQNADLSTVSGELLPRPDEPVEILKQKRFKYLYEPSVINVAELFAHEILASVFEQIIRESQLAKFAARLMHLDRSLENINGWLQKISLQAQTVAKSIANRKQNSTVAGVMVRRA